MAFRPWRLLVAFNWGAQAVSCGPPGPPTSFSPGAAPLASLYLEAQSGRSPGVLSAGHESRGDGLVYQAAHGTWTGEERCPGPALPTQPVTRLVSEGTSGRVPVSVTSSLVQLISWCLQGLYGGHWPSGPCPATPCRSGGDRGLVLDCLHRWRRWPWERPPRMACVASSQTQPSGSCGLRETSYPSGPQFPP